MRESPARPGSNRHDWELVVARGAAATLHDQAAALLASPPVRPLVRVSEATSRAVVLGSSQPSSDMDEDRLVAAGVELARRRSGGGAVLVGPGQSLWVDVVMPADSPGWDDDVRAAAVWMGRRWEEALGDMGVPGPERPGGGAARSGVAAPVVWAGGMQRRLWSKLVCFAGVGPGEVLLEGRKLVGVSQRRTRAGALFQCAVLLRWNPGDLGDLLALSEGERTALRRDLADVATVVTPEVAAGLPAALRARLRAATASRVA